MEMFFSALAGVFDPSTFSMMLVGTVAGIIVGAIPGLSGSTGIILLLPLIYKLEMVPTLVVMAGVFCGSMYGGAIPAILIQTPGTPSAAATVFDGYPLARAGKAGKAITVALMASVTGGLVSGICLTLLSPLLAQWALKFQAPEYFALALFGLSLIASSGDNLIKGLISGFTGLFVSCIGVDVITGSARFTGGTTLLMGGVNVLPLLVGLFAMTQVLIDANSKDPLPPQETGHGSFRLTKEEWKRIALPLAITAVVGVVIGIIPGAGGAIACFMGYEAVKRISKHPEEFGHGSIEGLAAAECSNNACTGGDMIPLITMGVPGDSITAVMLGVFMLVGIRPGPQLFTNHAFEMNVFFVSFMLIQFVILIIGSLGTRMFIKILKIPRSILMSAVMMLCFIGAYSLTNSTRDAWFALVFCIIGFVMKKFKFPAAPVVLGLVLGPMAEQNLNRTLLLHRGDISVLFTRPISLTLIIISVFSIGCCVVPAMVKFFKEGKVNA